MQNEMLRPPSERLNICIIVSTYPRHEGDYAVPWLRESISHFIDRGHKVTVLAPSYRGLKDHTIAGVPVIRYRYAPKRIEALTHEQGAPNKIKGLRNQWLGVPYVLLGRRAAIKLAKKEKFDIIHAHWPFPHEPMATAAARVCKCPLIMTCHGAEFALARRKGWVKEILRRALGKADALVANSTDTARKIKELSGLDSEIIPFGTTVSAPDVAIPPKDRPRILYTGRLIERKGVEFLIRAMPAMLEATPLDLVITGDGDQRERLEQLARDLGVADKISFKGFVSNEQLNEEYAACDVWVNPSIIDSRGDTEGLGVGSMEAYAHSKPVVASDVGGIPDTIRHGETGWLVPEKDELALAESILDLVQNPDRAKRFGKAGFKFAQETFSWNRITDLLENQYRDLLGMPRLTTVEEEQELEAELRLLQFLVGDAMPSTEASSDELIEV